MPELHYREFTIKKKNGKTRRICAPSPEALAYQRSILPRLNSLFIQKESSKNFDYPVFHGFVKNRNCVTAALAHQGFAHTITIDISNFFDSVHLDTILGLPSDLNTTLLTHVDGTLAQGFATSPILANLYLIDSAVAIYDYLKENFASFAYTVYADDMQISIPSSTYEEMDAVIAYCTQILRIANLQVNRSKTRIRHSKYGNRKVLGIQVGTDSLHPTRKLKKKIRAARHQGNHCSLGGLVTQSRMLLPKVLRQS